MTEIYRTEAAVERVARGVVDRSLPKAEWTHAAHFAAALWLLKRHQEALVRERMPHLIRAYNEATGVPNTDTDGYHETITLASIAAANAFLAGQPSSRPLHMVVDQLMASPLGRSDWPLAYWSKDLLFSVSARRGWVDPDLSDFDPGQFRPC